MTKTESIQFLVDFFKEVNCSFNVRLTNGKQTSSWDTLFIQPAESYVEFGQTGPVRISELEWIDINPIEQVHLGCRIPDKLIDHTERIITCLDENAIQYTQMDKTIRVHMGES
ncbi:MAG: hypothetical protein L6Q78_16105 [Bacteroidia bacterium]|nr:hypothetical protein [Bacteroidia bacterium]